MRKGERGGGDTKGKGKEVWGDIHVLCAYLCTLLCLYVQREREVLCICTIFSFFLFHEFRWPCFEDAEEERKRRGGGRMKIDSR